MLSYRFFVSLGGGGFALLTLLVATGQVVGWDQAIAQQVHNYLLSQPSLQMLARILTVCGDRWVLVLVALIMILGVVIWGRDRRTAVIWAATAILTPVLTTLFKYSFVRPRPQWDQPIEFESGYSFPSGHATGATIIYGLLAGLAYRSLSGWPRWLTVTFLISIIVLTGLSRVALGVHFPADVLAGFAIGLAVVATALGITSPFARSSEYASRHDHSHTAPLS
jgi:undecaprenyl-diphosphatase